jgi:hypothetical protein
MELTADINECITAFICGLTSSGIIFYKLAAMLTVKRALWKN